MVVSIVTALVDELATVAMRQEHKGRDPLRDQLVDRERDGAFAARETDGERPGVAIEGDVEDAPVREATPWYLSLEESARAVEVPPVVLEPVPPVYLTC